MSTLNGLDMGTLGSRAQHWVPMPMPTPMPTHAHAHAHAHPCPWVLGGHGCDIMFMGRHGWAWVRYYFSWVGVGAILFFMGGRGWDNIVHWWA
jgi:TM2 domain-containing membrane protein YozV